MDNTEFYDTCRQELVEYIHGRLIGPAQGVSEEFSLNELPTDRYLMGILYPQDMSTENLFSGEDKTIPAGDTDEVADTPLSMIFQKLPASMGISFFLRGEPELVFELSGACYRKVDQDKESDQSKVVEGSNGKKYKKKKFINWKRFAIAEKSKPKIKRIKKPPINQEQRIRVLDDKAILYILWRPRKDGYLVTVTLINAAQASNKEYFDREDIEKCIFQSGLKCRPASGVIEEYPLHGKLSFDEEEEELALIYRNEKTYAVGHGCAAWWGKDKVPPEIVSAEFMPMVEVKPITTEKTKQIDDERITDALRLQFLADESVTADALRIVLNGFVSGYADWFNQLKRQKINGLQKEIVDRILIRIENTLKRMRDGVKYICENDMARKAFSLANRVMLMQMIHSEKEFGGGYRNKDDVRYRSPDYGAQKYNNLSWRPFQLAFQLVTLRSILDAKCKERDFVDLIWFPTGGGKTEAYLGLAALEIIHRRLKNKDLGAGTSVIMRYTLRLLTTQQFERAATMICALENIRQKMKGELGEEPITLGLWVGSASTPNSFTSSYNMVPGSLEMYSDMIEQDKPENSFQLQRCPWCGTRIVPRNRIEDETYYGISASETHFFFYCTTESCDFHELIPLNIVDEHLFKKPPSLLIGTIDKFARLAWDNRSETFFGGGKNRRHPPSLIIQDELHLISGPLGTISGIYESAIDTIIEASGEKPKIIAATATIRRAEDQVYKLYGRKVRIFPPPGLSADDSYFARTDNDATGRLYIGVMGQGHTPMTSLVKTSAVLAQAVKEIDLPSEAVDTWWTQVIYHNSRRELGKTMTLARDDIPSRVMTIASDENNMRELPNVEELSATVSGTRIPEVLKMLETSLPDPETIDVLPCTNMISVGVDISRLGLMLINGQPKTTAEYIQASSRIGRDQSRPPGIVVALYTATKPRDRSHYENFTSYHQSLYRAVEPTSVTPFAPPARDRAMHAAIVILARLAGGFGENDDAERFDPNDTVMDSLLSMLELRMIRAEPDEANAITETIKQITSDWIEEIERAASENQPLRYYSKAGRQFASLLYQFGRKQQGLWPTLNSMRHVDQESLLKVMGEDYES